MKITTTNQNLLNEVKNRAVQVSALYREVLKNDEHYGIIPGTQKPALFKSGAEKLLSLFNLGVRPRVTKTEITDPSTGSVIGFEYLCEVDIFNIASNQVIGVGIGIASTLEEKYRWRRAVCTQEFKAAPENLRRSKWYAGKNGTPPYAVEQVQVGLFEQSNTCLKMAKKRAVVDGALTALGASDIFTQDTDDESVQDIINANSAPAAPESQPETPKVEVLPPVNNKQNPLSALGLGYRIEGDLVLVTGNTFACKEQIKALGFKWNQEMKSWAKLKKGVAA